MRRWRRMILLAVLALATTLLSAVGLSVLRRDWGTEVPGQARFEDGYHQVRRHRLLGAEIIHVQFFAKSAAPAGSLVFSLPHGVRLPPKDGHDGYWATTIAYGVPFPFLYGSTNQPTGKNHSKWSTRGFIVARDAADVQWAQYAPPLRPDAIYIPTGIFPLRFLGSVLCWALPWAAVLFGPVVARWWTRRGFNTCASCGYDRRGLADEALCPERGAASMR